MSTFPEHDHYTRCKEFIPKPRKKYAGFLVQCSYCGRVYKGYYDGYSESIGWRETELRSNKK